MYAMNNIIMILLYSQAIVYNVTPPPPPPTPRVSSFIMLSVYGYKRGDEDGSSWPD